MVKHFCSYYETLLMLCLLMLPVSVFAQDSTRVTISGKQMPLSAIFKNISRQTGYYFVFDNDIINEKQKVNAGFKKIPWETVLKTVLKDKHITWSRQGKRIFLQQVAYTEPPPADADTNHFSVTGFITGPGNIPLPGVTVMVKNTLQGVTTSNDGSFTLQNVPRHAMLHISFLGFTSLDTVLSSTRPHSIQLQEAVNNLDVAVVIGYGASSRRLLTGAVSRISGVQIDKQPVANPLAALQGQVPGVLVTNTNGMPGAEVKVYIRGRNSIAAGNDPLFIIDGVPFDIAPLNNLDELLGASKHISPFNSINPADIESIDILKDADATAIYGSRGANGVVLITTRKGKPGKRKLELNVYEGFGKTDGHLRMLNTPQYLAMRREAFKIDGVEPTAVEAPDLLVWDTKRNIDWPAWLAGGTAPVTNGQLSFSGGNNYTTYLLSGSYYREGSVLPAELSYHRAGAHLNIHHRDKAEKVEATLTAAYTGDKNSSIANDVFSLYNLPPNYPLYDQTGNFFWGSSFDNPAAYLTQKGDSRTNNLIGNGVLRYQPLQGLYLKANMGYASISTRQVFTFPQSSMHPENAPSSSTREAGNKRYSYIVEPQADYTFRIGKGSMHALMGGTFQRTITRGDYAEGQGYADESNLGKLGAADTIIRRPDTYMEYRYISFFSRFTYNWLDKYIANVSYRRDGSSRFGPGRQYGNFGALGAAWLFTKEPWMKAVPWLSHGKIRLSAGLTGNDQIPDYQYMSNYGANASYQNNVTLSPLRIANNSYSWEENRKFEGALELGLFNDRFFLSVAKYSNRSSNQLVGYQLPAISGFSSYQANLPAVVLNRGWEFEVSSTNFKGKNFTWTTNYNLTFFNNRLKKFQQLATSSYANTFVIGQSLNIVKGYHFTGVNPETGIAMFEDIDKDGRLTSGNDYMTIANKDPKYYGGFSNDFHYKQFELSCFFQFVKQMGQIQVNTPGDMKNETLKALKRWKQEGDITDVPRATAIPGYEAYDMNINLALSNAAYVDASYIRLRNLYLAYSLPEEWIKREKLQQAKIYLQGQNLLTFTDYKGADPETQLALPPLRILSAGIQITL